MQGKEANNSTGNNSLNNPKENKENREPKNIKLKIPNTVNGK